MIGSFSKYFNPRISGRLSTKKTLQSRKKAERTKLKQALQQARMRAKRNWSA